MTDVRDPLVLLRHAAQVGDWRLFELLARALSGSCGRQLVAGDRAYRTLVLQLKLSQPGD